MTSRRTVFSLLNTAFLGTALAVWILYPQYAVYLLYVLAAWIAISLTLGWSNLGSRTTAPSPSAGGPAGSSGAGGAAPVAAPAAAAPIDFCIYCGTRFDPGERRCRACGHPLVLIAAPG